MKKRDFKNIYDLTTEEIHEAFRLARELKGQVPTKRFTRRLVDKVLAMVFEKPSLRTRCTFEIAMLQMGGSAIYLGPGEIGLGKRESVHDVAKNLERWFDLVMVRTFAQSNVEELAHHCKLPVVNALSDSSHPCQAMADFLTLLEKRKTFDGLELAYMGDGNNICHSLLRLSSRLGTSVRVATPEGYEPDQVILEGVREEADKTGARVLVTNDPTEAVSGANAVYTDVWASMGQENEADDRAEVFQPYQVNAALMSKAADGAFAMHDLPAHRGEEITDEVMDGRMSICFDQAENRLHAQKAILVMLDEWRD